jgi:Type II secretion system (T2SS), protein M subtype b
MIDIDRAMMGRRVAALAILATLLLVASPLYMAPVTTYLEKRSAIDQETAVLMQVKTRQATVLGIADTAPLIRSASREDAAAALMARIYAAAPNGSFALLGLTAAPPNGEKPALVEAMISAQATPSGLRDFAAALESGSPRLVISSFNISRLEPATANSPADPIKLNLFLTVSAIFVKEPKT